MKEALDLKSKSGIHRLINVLEERKFIRSLPNRARALEVVKLPEGMERNRTPIAADTIPKTVAPPIPIADTDVVDIHLHARIAAAVPPKPLEGQTMLSVHAGLWGSGEHHSLTREAD